MKSLRLVLTLASMLWLTPALAEPTEAEPGETPFEWATEYSVGETFPAFALNDQNGEQQTSQSLSGEKGYLILFNRSVVW